jgi:hypothetical protein
MSTEDKQNKKGFFAKLSEFFKGGDGSGCSCNCLRTVWEKYAQEEAKKDNQGKNDTA